MPVTIYLYLFTSFFAHTFLHAILSTMRPRKLQQKSKISMDHIFETSSSIQ